VKDKIIGIAFGALAVGFTVCFLSSGLDYLLAKRQEGSAKAALLETLYRRVDNSRWRHGVEAGIHIEKSEPAFNTIEFRAHSPNVKLSEDYAVQQWIAFEKSQEYRYKSYYSLGVRDALKGGVTITNASGVHTVTNFSLIGWMWFNDAIREAQP